MCAITCIQSCRARRPCSSSVPASISTSRLKNCQFSNLHLCACRTGCGHARRQGARTVQPRRRGGRPSSNRNAGRRRQGPAGAAQAARRGVGGFSPARRGSGRDYAAARGSGQRHVLRAVQLRHHRQADTLLSRSAPPNFQMCSCCHGGSAVSHDDAAGSLQQGHCPVNVCRVVVLQASQRRYLGRTQLPSAAAR